MSNKAISVLVFLIFSGLLSFSQSGKTKAKRIIIESQIPASFYKKLSANINNDSLEMEYVVYDYVDMDPQWNICKGKIVNNNIKWILESNKSLILMSSLIGNGIIVNPGDSVSVVFSDKGKDCFGIGEEAMRLQFEIEMLRKALKKPTKNYVTLASIQNYFDWKNYLDKQLDTIIPLIDSYKSKISSFSYNVIKANTVRDIEFQRGESFMGLLHYRSKYKAYEELSPSNLSKIIDSTLKGKWHNWLMSKSELNGDPWYFYQFNRIQVWNRFAFNLKNDSVNSESKRRIIYYNTLKQNFKGLLRERLLQYVLADEVIKELGYNDPLAKTLLKDYYAMPGFQEYKRWMKEYEIKAGKLYVYDQINKPVAPDFKLENADGLEVTKKDLKGKIALLDFWFSGCTGCAELTPSLQKVEEAFKGDSNVVFVSISTDKNKLRWLKSVDQKKYTTGNGIKLYTQGQGSNHNIVKDYNISAFPELYLLTPQGTIAQYPLPDPRKDKGEALINLIRKKRAELNDGPYVMYKDDSILISYINNTNSNNSVTVQKKTIRERESITLEILTDQFPKKFTAQLKSTLTNEPAEFSAPAKQLVLSDIEGNFDAFRKLLQSSGVIDDKFDWTFGDGHLVCVGDFFDRGEQVTEVLWLIYTLEEKAKAKGGYVHFILGNHEILNLSNDQRYVQDKYKQSSRLLNQQYEELYGVNSELGRWLRTKNIMEKIGDVLYTHGGISREINNLPYTILEMNELVRPKYASRDSFKLNKNTPALKTLFSSTTSPFWYRNYYLTDNQLGIIDSTLQKFNVSQIITGHTIVADTISVHYGGKVINTDTHHADGKSEALLIEGNKYYRLNCDGKKELYIYSKEQFYTAKPRL
jgi:thiol-disulfide isomerase/thioredoxin